MTLHQNGQDPTLRHLTGRAAQQDSQPSQSPPTAEEQLEAARGVHIRLGLRERQVQVLALMARGMNNAEIGRTLGVVEDTVKTHAKRVFKKLQVTDRTQATAVALRTGALVLTRNSSPKPPILSRRELQIVRLLGEGYDNGQIGAALGISHLTVKSHIARIGKRLKASNRTRIFVICYKEGWMD